MKTSRRVMYLRDEKFMPVGCVAISLNKNRTQVRYQLSVLNPVDKFERDLARHIALGRLLEKPVRLNYFPGNQNQFEISLAVMEDIASNSSLPGRARKAARNWLRDNDVAVQ